MDTAPSPEPSVGLEDASPAAPPPQEPDAEQASSAQNSGGWGPKYDYDLLDPEMEGDDGAGPEDAPDQDSPYGAFDLIEALSQDVGGEQKEGQR